MKFSYNKLWKLLIDRNMNKGDLQKLIETGPSTISRMGRNEPVRLEILGRICERLNCNIEDIIEYERGKQDV
ncbi:helix-turn-helix transcriptional regulator [Histophilus somni]|jgi:transcriptional regulator|uniref:Helix-turn-helix transcriptional regulator n=2 Tax=Bacteria TaxID=2 RepID=A0A9Q6Z036_HISSO|nr:MULTISPECIES: helix-turn-helix transcriptional regulator [Bacteria]AVM69456.1 XRE family transcriptional regulator [Lachnospiraceae bacterium oral taxon 500]ARU65340.1 transcriptional regulator [Histophilus somni]ARU67207.1 transcriptional regulator [Histophilus somni]ARU69084.1 transcriptional regulator [Histophilus somni]ARU70962.1 transcriptional regulator [Histophilus somni]